MCAYELTVNDKGGVENGILRFTGGSCDLLVTIPVGNEFHTEKLELITKKSDKIVAKAVTQYRTLEDYVWSIKVSQAGSWFFQLKNENHKGPLVRFIVDPVLRINGKEVNPSALAIQTNFPRCLGPLNKWEQNLAHVSRLGFNMVHLPPFQQNAGESLYAITDQLSVSSDLAKGTKEQNWKEKRKDWLYQI